MHYDHYQNLITYSVVYNLPIPKFYENITNRSLSYPANKQMNRQTRVGALPPPGCSGGNKYVGPPYYCRAEMYAVHVACCPLVSHVEYAPRAPINVRKRRDRQTDGRQTVTLRLPLCVASVITRDLMK